jgi:hypothetical protein
MSTLLALLAAVAPQGPGSSTAPVVINEFVHDDAGLTDDREFVELFNRSAAPVDLSGWRLQGEEGSAGGLPNGAFTFPVGTIIQPGEYLVVGSLQVPNANFTTSSTSPPEWLGENVAGSANLPDGMTLRDAGGAVIDAVCWNFAVWTATVPAWLEGSGLWGAMQMIDLSAQPAVGLLSAQRWQDGFDSNDNGRDFVAMQWTPGAANGSLHTVLPNLVENCDSFVGDNLNGLLSFSFVPATIQDPAAVAVATGAVRAYPPSPQGGNVVRAWDPTGGGNMLVAQTLPLLGSFLFEAWVHVAPGNPAMAAGEGESWSIGVRGTTDSFGHPHDAGGTYYAQAALCANRSPGGTGVAWMAYVRNTQTDLYLVDAGNGGPGLTVLAGPIVCNAAQNSGWQRLRLRVDGTQLVANFGGTFGADDGQRFTATVADVPGAVWLQYRECLIGNGNITGLLLDRIELYSAMPAQVSYSGQGSPTSGGTPSIAAVGSPVVGNVGFQLAGGNLLPFGVSLVALDVGALLPGVPVPGGAPTLALYANPAFVGTALNSATGTAAFALPLPAVNALIGTPVAAQYFDVDAGLPYALPLGSSRGCQIVLGN